MRKGEQNKSFAGNICWNQKRHDQINKKLSELAQKATAPMTFSEIAEYIGASKQAVYQIEKGALKKIRKKYLIYN